MDRPAAAGTGRVYSYDDWLQNLAGCDMHSAVQIIAAWQDIKTGDEIRLHPDVALVVAAVNPGQWLVIRGGIPVANGPSPFDFTWSFVLRAQQDRVTRLIVRERYACTRPWASLLVEPVQAIDFVMTRKMLRTIKNRAERAA